MNKFEALFRKQLGLTWNHWKEREEGITHEEVYRFIHSIKGTALTIGMSAPGEAAARLLEQIDEEEVRLWAVKDLWEFIRPLHSLLEQDELNITSLQVPEWEDIDKIPTEFQRDKEALIMIVDDDISMLKLAKSLLEQQGWMVLATTSADRAVEWFYGMKPDCVLLDLILPEKDGFAILESLQKQSELFLVPVIMISGRSDKPSRLRSFAAGADDFISKPWDHEEFVARVGRQLQRRKLVSRLLLVDELTGVYNRVFLEQELNRQLMEFNRSRETLIMVSLDVDHFQVYNKNNGYAAGDKLLKKLTQLFISKIRINDYLARDHADRFYLLLPKTDMKHAVKLLGRLQAEFQRETGANFTAALMETEQEGITVETCLRAAQKAIAEAKQEAIGQIHVTNLSKYETVENGKIRIAVIDDDPLIRRMLQKQLSDVGGDRVDIEIRGFSDGEHFFDDDWHKQAGKFIVVLDRMMPKMNGMEVLKRLRTLYDRRRYTIIMLTSISNEDEIAQAIEAGTDDYVTKPFSLVELEARIRRLVKGLKK